MGTPSTFIAELTKNIEEIERLNAQTLIDYNSLNDDEKRAAITKCLEIHHEFILSLKILLNKALLAGDYYYSRAKDEIIYQKKAIKKVLSDADTILVGSNFQIVYEEYKVFEHLDLVSDFIEIQRQNLDESVDRKYYLNSNLFLQIDDRVLRDDTKQYAVDPNTDGKKEIERDYLLIRVNIKTCYIDSTLVCSTKHLEDLSLIESILSKTLSFNEPNLELLRKILVEKVKYLKYKIKERFKKVDFVSLDFVDDKPDNEYETYSLYKRATESVYSDGTKFDKGKDIVWDDSFCTNHIEAKACRRSVNELNIEDVTKKIEKLIKDNEDYIEPLEILTRFTNRSKYSKGTFYAKCRIRAIAQFIDSATKDETIDVEKIKSQMEILKRKFLELTATLKSKHIQDPYIYFHYLNAYINYFKYLIKRKEISIINDSSKDYFALQEHLEDYNKAIEKLSARPFLPVYPSFSESVIKIRQNDSLPSPSKNFTTGENQIYFLESSYILPINIEDLKVQFEASKNKFSEVFLRLLQTSHEFQIKESFSKIENAQTDLNNSISNNQIKNIEVLGIFSAIIAIIVAGGISVPKMDNAVLLIIFLLGLSTAIVLFIFSLDYLLSKEEKFTSKRKGILWVCISLVFIVIVLTIINESYYRWHLKDKELEYENKRHTDSVNRLKVAPTIADSNVSKILPVDTNSTLKTH